jgi:hypothetical protein
MAELAGNQIAAAKAAQIFTDAGVVVIRVAALGTYLHVTVATNVEARRVSDLLEKSGGWLNVRTFNEDNGNVRVSAKSKES